MDIDFTAICKAILSSALQLDPSGRQRWVLLASILSDGRLTVTGFRPLKHDPEKGNRLSEGSGLGERAPRPAIM
ncbi:hypothetical protein [Mesorhizobium kowhaii]|uniref:Uncharacterized protein n=1 Tax=Mesorhizobium kowhaii TaxID=1300272 RepID=A0A2W7C8K1_9HYPH|nr:hypothetical protein [Mesorhizobium kowhaii]PZV39502.1 hypothetical protein B5V02_05930 [Mesorhizobium kowhaii]